MARVSLSRGALTDAESGEVPASFRVLPVQANWRPAD